MTARLARKARGLFFVRIGGVGRRDDRMRDDYTLPLFPLALILDADGTLPTDCAHLLDVMPNQ